MSFENGSVSFVPFFASLMATETLRGALPKFVEKRAEPLEALTPTHDIYGWVTGRHLLDRNITTETAFPGGYLRLDLMTAKLSLPGSLLTAECRIEEEAHKKATGYATVSKKAKAEIKKRVTDRLIKHAQPELKGTPFALDALRNLFYVGALSERQIEFLMIMLTTTLESDGFSLVQYTPDVLAAEAKHDVKQWKACSFSPDNKADDLYADPGAEFLTWLWFMAEACGGMKKIGGKDTAIIIEGPLQFSFQSDEGKRRVTIEGESALVSAEAKSALMSGKKLSACKVTFAQGDRMWTGTVTSSLGIRGLKLPTGEKVDPVSNFQQRMDDIAEYWTVLKAFFVAFCKERSARSWPDRLIEVQKWVENRRVAS